jgi:hypothetical protein
MDEVEIFFHAHQKTDSWLMVLPDGQINYRVHRCNPDYGEDGGSRRDHFA